MLVCTLLLAFLLLLWPLSAAAPLPLAATCLIFAVVMTLLPLMVIIPTALAILVLIPTCILAVIALRAIILLVG